MAPPTLGPNDEVLIQQMIETFMAGRSNSYPSSHSDLKWSFISIIRMFDVKRRPLAYDPFKDLSRE